MRDFRSAHWYDVRAVSNRKPATYRCPLCDGLLPALSQHLLVVPEGDASRRRHAHTTCGVDGRQAGRLPFRDEVEPRDQDPLARLFRRSA